MDRILKWGCQRNGRPWYYNNENSKLVIRDVPQTNEIKPITSNDNPPVVKMKMQVNNQVKKIEKKDVNIDKKKVEPEWKQDEEEILKGDKYSSYSYGGGRFGNQIIRNLAMCLIAEKFDLCMRYQISEEIEKLGIKLFNGKKKYRKHKVVDERNYYGMLKRESIYFNVRSNPMSFYQTKEITDDINIYLNSPTVMKKIIDNNVHKERYNNNNDCFVHVRLGDVVNWTPGFDYYYKLINQFNFDNLYIATDSPGHEIIAMLRKKFPKLQIYDTNLPDIMLFGSTCKYVVLSYGSFSAVIGYLSFFSHVFYKKVTHKTAWDWFSGDKNNMFNDKYTKIGQWKEIQ